MDMVSVSSLASTTSIRPQLKSSAEDGLNPKFAEDFPRLANQDVNIDSTKPVESVPDTQATAFKDIDSFSSLLEQANSMLQQRGSSLMFEIDSEMNRPVLFIKDTETKEVIRQVPSDSYLDMSRKITDYLERSAAGSMSSQSTSAVGLLTTAVA